MTLKEEVKKIIESYDDPEEILKEVLNYGCVNGTIPEMVYYKDTLAFYERHKEEISELLNDLGITPSDLNGFDDTDPLCLETHNQNLLTWFGFEEICMQLLDEMEET